MRELFEQTTKMMEKSWNLWQQMVEDSPLMKKPEVTFWGKWSPWIATMRSTYEVNMNAWKTFVENSEQTFFKMFKESPLYNESLETQMRGIWDGLKKAQDVQQEAVKEQLSKMEDLLREHE